MMNKEGDVRMKRALSRWLYLVVFVLTLAASPIAPRLLAYAVGEETDPTGEWLVAKRVARIKIVNCDNRMWGVLSWEASPGVDSNNPDPSQRGRPTLGMPILLGMEQSKPNEWKGDIYNAEDGHKYSASISLLNPDLLKVQGCVLGILCGGENWTRVSAPAPAPAPAPPAKKTPGKQAKAGPSPDEQICLDLAGSTGSAH